MALLASFMTFKETRPWAKAIREAVLTRRMPPWFADPHVGKFSNDRSLSQADIDTLVKWSDTGAVEGNPKDAPPPRQFVQGWNIGTPEYTVEMPVVDHPVSAAIGRRNTGNEKRPPIATQPSTPPAATITQR